MAPDVKRKANSEASAVMILLWPTVAACSHATRPIKDASDWSAACKIPVYSPARASLPHSMPSCTGRSNELPCACGCKCCMRLVLHTLGQRHGGLPSDASYSEHAASVSLSTESVLASEIRGPGRVLNTAKGLSSAWHPPWDPATFQKTSTLWWIKVFNSELPLASLLCVFLAWSLGSVRRDRL